MADNSKLNYRCISGSTLKIIALITMCIDHIAAILIYGYVMSLQQSGMAAIETTDVLIRIYYIFRMIGRVSFPIYIFLMIEGLRHTANQWKYAIRLFIFAVVSEIPFDLAFNISRIELSRNKFLEFESQNVFFTLFIGLIVIICIKEVADLKLSNWLKALSNIAVIVAGAFLAAVLSTDYSYFGVLAIVAMYLFRDNIIIAVAAMTTILTFLSKTQIVTLIVLIPLHFYNGKRGLGLKWIFYIFYPAHLLLLWLVGSAMGVM